MTDLIAHLAEWQCMFLGWYESGRRGIRPQLPAPGFRWNETAELNRAIGAKYRGRSFGEVRAAFDRGYRRILRLVRSLPQEHLLEPGHFVWTGRNALVTYIGANTASHYRFALRILTRRSRGLTSPKKRGGGGTGA